MQPRLQQGWRRWLALVALLLGLLGAGFFWSRDRPAAFAADAPPPAASAADDDESGEALAPPASDVTPADREARRFARYDRDGDARVGRDEYLANRRKSFAKLDLDRDGKLGFEEYAAATAKKFTRADLDGDGSLAAKEFAATAVKRRPAAACRCAGTDAGASADAN
ncbi:hypothetical protein IP88_00610 [alpha proteobacterium AAP81b]|nr:hypothetical protein IP88_00610 [alpha proteobacterium AAP81b]